MPKLLINIEGLILDTKVGTISNEKLVQTSVGIGDYMKLFRFTGYFVELSYATNVIEYDTPKNLGLKNNTSFIELNISY
jgi:hypothetical protein